MNIKGSERKTPGKKEDVLQDQRPLATVCPARGFSNGSGQSDHGYKDSNKCGFWQPKQRVAVSGEGDGDWKRTGEAVEGVTLWVRRTEALLVCFLLL